MPRTEKENAKIAAIRDELIATTRAFCLEHLDEEHADLAEKMVRKLGRKRDAPFMRGARKNWAAGIVHAIAQLNFLFDRSQEIHTTPTEIAVYFGANKDTISGKAHAIRKMLGARQFGQEFSNAKNSATGERLDSMTGAFIMIQRMQDVLEADDDNP